MTAAADLVMMVNTYGSEPDTLYYEMTDVLLSKASIGSDNYLSKPMTTALSPSNMNI